MWRGFMSLFMCQKKCFHMQQLRTLFIFAKYVLCAQEIFGRRNTLCSRNEKVTKVSAGPKFSHFPTETYLVVVKYQKFPKSIERNWGFWIIFDLERVGHFFEIKSKDDIQMALLTLTWILILVIQIEIQLWILFGKPMW